MQHLKLVRDSYRYRTAETGDVIEVEVRYNKGESARRRGIFIDIAPMKIADGCISFEIFTGKSAFAVQLNRKNDKEMLKVAETIDAAVPAAVEMFATDKKAALEMLLAPLRASVAATA